MLIDMALLSIDSAISKLKKIIADNPDKNYSAILEGLNYFKNLEFLKAEDIFKQALKQDKNDFIPVYFRAFYEYLLDIHLSTALNLLDYIIYALGKNDCADVLILRAEISRRLRKFQSADQDLDTAFKFDPINPDMFLIRSAILMDRDDFGNAMIYLNQAFQFNSNPSFTYYYLRSRIYLTLDNPASALRDINKALKLNPDNYFLYMIKSGIELSEHNTEESDRTRQKVENMIAQQIKIITDQKNSLLSSPG